MIGLFFTLVCVRYFGRHLTHHTYICSSISQIRDRSEDVSFPPQLSRLAVPINPPVPEVPPINFLSAQRLDASCSARSCFDPITVTLLISDDDELNGASLTICLTVLLAFTNVRLEYLPTDARAGVTEGLRSHLRRSH